MFVLFGFESIRSMVRSTSNESNDESNRISQGNFPHRTERQLDFLFQTKHFLFSTIPKIKEKKILRFSVVSQRITIFSRKTSGKRKSHLRFVVLLVRWFLSFLHVHLETKRIITKFFDYFLSSRFRNTIRTPCPKMKLNF